MASKADRTVPLANLIELVKYHKEHKYIGSGHLVVCFYPEQRIVVSHCSESGSNDHLSLMMVVYD